MKKLFKRLIYALIGIATILAAWIFVEELRSEGYIGERKLGFETEYLGVKIGDSLADAVFYLGPPDSTTETLEPDTKLYYFTDGDLVTIVALNEASKSVVGIGAEGTRSDLPNLKWLSGYTRVEWVEDRLGQPDSSTHLAGGQLRVLVYEKHNLRLAFSKNGIVSILIGRLPPTAPD